MVSISRTRLENPSVIPADYLVSGGGCEALKGMSSLIHSRSVRLIFYPPWFTGEDVGLNDKLNEMKLMRSKAWVFSLPDQRALCPASARQGWRGGLCLTTNPGIASVSLTHFHLEKFPQ